MASQSQKEYPLSLDETLRLAEIVQWHGYHDVPPSFGPGFFYGDVGNTSVRLMGDSMKITARLESPRRYCAEDLCLAHYEHKKFGEIYDKLAHEEITNVGKRTLALVVKLKRLANASGPTDSL